MDKWTEYAFGNRGAFDPGLLSRALDYCLGEEVASVVRIFPTIRPYQLRRLCLFLAGLSDKETAIVTGDGVPAVRVARWRFRKKLADAGPEGRRLAERIARREEEGGLR